MVRAFLFALALLSAPAAAADHAGHGHGWHDDAHADRSSGRGRASSHVDADGWGWHGYHGGRHHPGGHHDPGGHHGGHHHHGAHVPWWDRPPVVVEVQPPLHEPTVTIRQPGHWETVDGTDVWIPDAYTTLPTATFTRRAAGGGEARAAPSQRQITADRVRRERERARAR